MKHNGWHKQKYLYPSTKLNFGRYVNVREKRRIHAAESLDLGFPLETIEQNHLLFPRWVAVHVRPGQQVPQLGLVAVAQRRTVLELEGDHVGRMHAQPPDTGYRHGVRLVGHRQGPVRVHAENFDAVRVGIHERVDRDVNFDVKSSEKLSRVDVGVSLSRYQDARPRGLEETVVEELLEGGIFLDDEDEGRRRLDVPHAADVGRNQGGLAGAVHEVATVVGEANVPREEALRRGEDVEAATWDPNRVHVHEARKDNQSTSRKCLLTPRTTLHVTAF